MTETPTRKTPSYPGDPGGLHPHAVTIAGPGGAEGVAPALDDKEKVAAVKSPTGTPKVKPSSVKWLFSAAMGAAAGLEYCAEHAPSEGWRFGCRVLQLAVVGFVGSASPGFRKR